MNDLSEDERMLHGMLMINSPKGPVDEIIVQVDLECSCVMV